MRRALKYSLLVQFLGVVALTASAQLPNCPLRPTPGSVVLDPLRLSSKNGELQLGLTLRNGADSLGYMHYCFDYSTTNGEVEAPTLRVNPGDTLTLDLTNQLNVPSPAATERLPAHGRDGRHGLGSRGGYNRSLPEQGHEFQHHQCPFPRVEHSARVSSGRRIEYSDPAQQDAVSLSDSDSTNEPPGLYWYHPHPHGFTTFQVNGGAAGAIIVGGMEKIKPQVAGLTQRVFMIRQQFLKPRGLDPRAVPVLAELSARNFSGQSCAHHSDEARRESNSGVWPMHRPRHFLRCKSCSGRRRRNWS